jgi:hypothetical protein
MRIANPLFLLACRFVGAARNQEISGKNLYRFVVLVEGRRSNADHAAIGPRIGGPYFEDFTLGVQFVAGANRARPAQFVEAYAQNATRRPKLTVDQKPHGHCGRMPSARRQTLKRRLPGGVLVEMKGLRIELPCESENLILFDAQPTGLENLSDREIFQESPLHVLLAPEGKSHDYAEQNRPRQCGDDLGTIHAMAFLQAQGYATGNVRGGHNAREP